MVADSVDVPAAPTAARCSSTPSTSSTATAATPSSRCACSRARSQAGASRLVLCDTNGGTLPARGRAHRARGRRLLRRRRRRRRAPPRRRRHAASPTRSPACAAARSQVQGTINGYGERTGNCNLTTIIPNLTLKMGIETLPRGPARAAHAGRAPRRRAREHGAQPAGGVRRLVGVRAQGRAARERDRRSAPTPTSTSPPDSVGNGTRFVVSELAGKSTLVLKAKELGLELDGPQLNEVVDTLKRLEHEGYHFEVADASLELLMRRATGWEQRWFEVESFRVITDDDDPFADADAPGGVTTEATIKVHVGDERSIATAEGNGPVNALDTRAAQRARRPLPGARAGAPHRLQGAGARHRSTAPAPSPACCSTPPTANARGPRSA